MHEYFGDRASCSKDKTPPLSEHEPSVKDAYAQAVDDGISNNSDFSQEMHRLKVEVERLLCQNSELRKEIARMKGEEPPDANEAGLCILSCSVLVVDTRGIH